MNKRPVSSPNLCKKKMEKHQWPPPLLHHTLMRSGSKSRPTPSSAARTTTTDVPVSADAAVAEQWRGPPAPLHQIYRRRRNAVPPHPSTRVPRVAMKRLPPPRRAAVPGDDASSPSLSASAPSAAPRMWAGGHGRARWRPQATQSAVPRAGGGGRHEEKRGRVYEGEKQGDSQRTGAGWPAGKPGLR